MKKRKLKIKITEEQLKKIVKFYNEEQLNEGFLSFIYEFLSEKIKKLIELFKNRVIDKKEFKSELESTASEEELEKIDTEYKKFKEDKKTNVEDIKNGKKTKEKDIQPEDLKDFKFAKIPGGQNNWRSAQITADILPSVIKKYGIKNIIRMSGDDEKHRSKHTKTPKDTERKICEENGCTYHYIDSHSGFKEGKGYTESIKKTSEILNKGNTLIHCAHGADRTGGMVGAYLKNNGYMTNKDEVWKYTTQYNNWQDKLNKNNFFGTGYDKYADGFYPRSELKNSKWAK
jgi:protein tyrosine/serine phosphatase